MNKKRVCVIINPKSGMSSKSGFPHRISAALDPHQFDVYFYITGYAGHASEIATQAVKDGVDYVIAVGGDGTVNEVGRCLVDSDVVLGIIPQGSGNGLGRDLNIPTTNIDKAISIIAEGNVISIDYGRANGHIFFCTCGMGFDAEVASRVSGKKNRGTLMYFKNMIEAFFEEKPEEYEIVCPEGVIKDKAFVVTCANASQYGYNAHIAPHADIQDGKMNITMLKPLSIIDIPQTSIQLFTRNLDENKKMVELMTRKATIRREKEGVMHLDGDPLAMGKELNIEIIEGGLKVLVPKHPNPKHPLDPMNILSRIFDINKEG